MFGENQETNPVQDAELEKAQRSMAGRVDPDPEPAAETVVEPETPVVEPPKKEEDEEPVVPPVEANPESVTPPKKEEEPPKDEKKINRPEAYIPMPKYLDEKKDWEKDKAELEETKAKLAELTRIASQKEGTQKDDDIEEFMEQTGFDKETVEGLLKLVTKRIAPGATMSPQEQEKIEQAQAIIAEKEMETEFNEEFKTVGESTLKKSYPKATDAQIALAKDIISKEAHTLEGRDKPLDFLIWKNQEELAKIFSEEPAPQTKRTIENPRMGNGKQTVFTAEDFKDGKTSFEALADLDSSTRAQIIKDMDSKTYTAFVQHTKNQAPGIEVTRNGKKITLK